ncbi:integrase core domain-containing protein [Candidatus Poriferisodalis sp.]|uniref:integrase core domain-containing protein n=1 Tax=Candidatus Poriferisodalis sp. TaxID=3101277 RepID=UPI003B024557
MTQSSSADRNAVHHFVLVTEGCDLLDDANLTEARVVLEDWRHDYNHHRPHRSLGGQTPAAYAANHQPTITTNQHP